MKKQIVDTPRANSWANSPKVIPIKSTPVIFQELEILRQCQKSQSIIDSAKNPAEFSRLIYLEEKAKFNLTK